MSSEEMSYVGEVRQHRYDLKLALMRAEKLWFTYKVTSQFIRNRTRTAYDSGYEAGWRGWGFDQPYASPHHQAAYRHGYSDATERLHKRALKEATND